MRGDDTAQEQAFIKIYSYLEANDEEQLITISDLNTSAYFDHENSVPYAASYLKRNLQDHYNDSIFIAEKDGLSDLVTFRDQTSFILRSYCRNERREDDDETQQKLIIETAAKLS